MSFCIDLLEKYVEKYLPSAKKGKKGSHTICCQVYKKERLRE
jgi:hypothetical protein